MGTRFARWLGLAAGLIGIIAASCTSFSTPVVTTITPRPPTVELVDLPQVVCSSATQVKVQVLTSNNLTAAPPATWELRTSSGQRLQEGTWVIRDGTFLVPFPDGRALPPGTYTLDMSWEGQHLAGHDFTVGPGATAIDSLNVSLVPDGSALAVLPAGVQVFYVGYSFEGGCVGAPYWISVRDPSGATVCNRNGILDTIAGTGQMACYREEAEAFAVGAYEVEMTLMGEVIKLLDFSVEPDPPKPTIVPSPSPTPPGVICDTLFTAAGITSEGESFLPLTLFDWYTQVVYAGTRCLNLLPETQWHSRWYHQGELIRESDGTWNGLPEGVVWDSLTGQPDAPFLLPGFYTVTLEISGVPLSAVFDVYQYEPTDTTE
jgi:hypothetical protein